MAAKDRKKRVTCDQPQPGQSYCVDPNEDDMLVVVENDTGADLDCQIFDCNGNLCDDQTIPGLPGLTVVEPIYMNVCDLPASGSGCRWFSLSNASFTTGFSFGVYSCSDDTRTRVSARCEYFGAEQPVVLALLLRFDTAAQADSPTAGEQLNRPVLLIHSQDHNFPWCWFSRPIDLSPGSGNPAFWMLKWSSPDTWTLYLRRFSGDLATYRVRTRQRGRFPLRLGLTSRDSGHLEKWPRTVTIRPAE